MDVLNDSLLKKMCTDFGKMCHVWFGRFFAWVGWRRYGISFSVGLMVLVSFRLFNMNEHNNMIPSANTPYMTQSDSTLNQPKVLNMQRAGATHLLADFSSQNTQEKKSDKSAMQLVKAQASEKSYMRIKNYLLTYMQLNGAILKNNPMMLARVQSLYNR